MKYRVTVGTREYAIEIAGARVTVDGVECQAGLESIPGTPLRQFGHDPQALFLGQTIPAPDLLPCAAADWSEPGK